jgi:predicted nucleic acid-binding Zn ribbon protein
MRSKKFTKWASDEYETIKNMFNGGMTYLEISEKIGRTKKSVRIKLNKMKLFQSERSKKERENDVYENLMCLNCGKEFRAYRRNKQKFCSQSCNASYNNKNRRINNPDKKKKAKCIHCGKDILISNYASLKGASCLKCNPDYGKPRIKYPKDIKKINDKFICINCGRELKKEGKFCSYKCQGLYRRKEVFKKIEDGDVSLPERNYKNYLIYKYGEKCMECGWDKINEYSGKIPIELEHKDGNAGNNNLSNLKLLCPNCHSLTSTYKFLNAGNGRQKRKQRYREGKIF